MSSDTSDPNLHWTTAITQVKPNEIRLRGHRLDQLMGTVSFAQAIFLTLTGELPTPEVGRLLDAMLVASIDHGATPPSVLAARTSASTGAPLNAALAAGILSINRYHGGAIEDCVRLIQAVAARMEAANLAAAQAARALVADYHAAKKRLPGFGHRIHTNDPRTNRLFELAEEAGVSSQGVQIVRTLADALAAQLGRELPINVDGAIAALLYDLQIAPELANAFFIMARVPGLVAHIHEEQTRERPMRRIHPTDHSYDGPLDDAAS
ncbi:MAG: citryl-CoA lyase [Anaerolineae bacterium]|nr:citryl-CoA lyase [Anaerolineae bacterium]